ncbi:uncharacterized protein LOC143567487 [Bidens hawaiensis]|uniref:uncharacterized protein LOC143567487 n=1 Tax=Bidens hawaiensis TaxID=980011 RepID=UPI00404B00BD
MMSIAAKAFGKKPGNKNPFPKKAELHKNKEKLVIEASKVRPNGSYLAGLKRNESEFSYSSRKIIASAHVKNANYNCQNLATASNVVGSSGQSSSIATDKRSAKKAIDATVKKENIKKDAQLGSSDQSSSKATDKRSTKKEIDSGLEEEENIKKDTQHDGNNKEIENAKSEIQSLVKLNLKLLSRDKKLEADVFKEVARHATHSIVAACGIEPPKARFRSFERLVCDHSQTQKRPSSTLMPTSCRECFFTFVKDVVSTIAIDTTTSCKP